MKDKFESEAWSLICFIVTSAANLEQEKKAYGPLRLLETATRLVSMCREHGVVSERLDAIQKEIETNKYSLMTDEAFFFRFLQDLALEIVSYL